VIRHEQFRTMVAWRDELSPAEQALLGRHLTGCPECRRAARLYAEVSERLRLLGRLRPPGELRQAVLSATEESEAAIFTYGLYLFALCIVPLSFVTVALLLAYGVVAWLGPVAALAVLGCLTTWQMHRREARVDLPDRTEREIRWGRLAQSIAVDAAEVAIGALLFAGVVLLLAFLLGAHGP